MFPGLNEAYLRLSNGNKIKSLITGALKKLPGSSLDTIEKIQAEIVSVEKKYADRKARLAAILAKRR